MKDNCRDEDVEFDDAEEDDELRTGFESDKDDDPRVADDDDDDADDDDIEGDDAGLDDEADENGELYPCPDGTCVLIFIAGDDDDGNEEDDDSDPIGIGVNDGDADEVLDRFEPIELGRSFCLATGKCEDNAVNDDDEDDVDDDDLDDDGIENGELSICSDDGAVFNDSGVMFNDGEYAPCLLDERSGGLEEDDWR